MKKMKPMQWIMIIAALVVGLVIESKFAIVSKYLPSQGE